MKSSFFSFSQILLILIIINNISHAQIYSDLTKPYDNDEYTIALWHFDETNGNQIHDASQNLNNGIATNTSFVSSMIGFNNAIEFKNDPIGTIEFGSFNLPQYEGTIEYWIKPIQRPSTGCDHAHFFVKGLNGHSAAGFTFYNRIYNNGNIDFGTGASGNDVWRNFDNIIVFGKWQHIAFTWNTVETKLYVNGVLVKILDPLPVGIGQTTQEVALGKWGSLLYPASRFIGMIDEFRISNIERHFKPVFQPISYCIQANQAILLDNYTNILSVNTDNLVTADFTGSTSMPMNGAFIMYWDKNLGHLFTYNEARTYLEFTPGTFNNQGYKFAPFLVDWVTLNDNTGQITVDLSTSQSTTLQANNAILLDNFPQFPIIGNFEEGKTYKVDISGSPSMPMQGVFVMYVDNGETKFDYIPIGGSLTFVPGVGTHKFCAFQVDWSTVGDNYGETCINIYETDSNNPPIASAGEDQIIDCSPLAGTNVVLDGIGSSDPDGDELTYTWAISDSVIGSGVSPTVFFSPGEYTITLTVDDGNGGTSSDDVLIAIKADTEAPVITIIGDNPLNLYRFGEPYQELGANVEDECDANPSLTITGNVNITLPGSYNITYTATDFNGNTSEEKRVVNVLDNPAYLSNPYLFLADEEVELDKQQEEVKGDIHSNAEIEIKKGPATYFSNITAVENIEIKKDITIEGDVRAGGELELEENVNITGISEEYVGIDYVDLEQFEISSEGENIKVKKDETYNLEPGSYGKVEVEKGAILNLITGQYSMKELKVKKEVELVFDITNGPIEINIEKKVGIKENVKMSLLPLGIDDSRYVIINTMKNINVDKESLVFGTLNAPYGEVEFKKDVEFHGSVSAKEIDIDKEVVSMYHADNNDAILAKSNKELSNNIVLAEEIQLPKSYFLNQNYPNPFNPTTNIQFSIPEANYVSLKIYDLLGKEVAVLVDETKSGGNYTYEFDASNLSSGVYVYRLQAGEFIDTKKLVLMK